MTQKTARTPGALHVLSPASDRHVSRDNGWQAVGGGFVRWMRMQRSSGRSVHAGSGPGFTARANSLPSSAAGVRRPTLTRFIPMAPTPRCLPPTPDHTHHMGLSTADVALVAMAMSQLDTCDMVLTLGKRVLRPHRAALEEIRCVRGLGCPPTDVVRRTATPTNGIEFQQSDYSAAWAARADSAGLRSSARRTSVTGPLAAIRHRVMRAALFRRLAPPTPVRGLNQEGLTPLTITDFVRSKPPAG